MFNGLIDSTEVQHGRGSSSRSVIDLQLDSREGLLTEAMNNGTRETRGFR
jgi:hypothetical protein